MASSRYASNGFRRGKAGGLGEVGAVGESEVTRGAVSETGEGRARIRKSRRRMGRAVDSGIMEGVGVGEGEAPSVHRGRRGEGEVRGSGRRTVVVLSASTYLKLLNCQVCVRA